MITACHNCSYNGAGAKLDALVRSLPVESDHKLAGALEHVRKCLLKRCSSCKRTNQDDIRIAKTPKNERPELTVQATKPAEPEQITALPADVEDTLRSLLCTICGFDMLDALLLLHVAKGGTPGNFGRIIKQLTAEAATYGDQIGRATAKAKWVAICKKFEPFAAMRSWGIGHGGRTANPDDDDEPSYTQGTLFE